MPSGDKQTGAFMMVRISPAQTIAAADHLPLRGTADSALEQVCERIVDAGLAGARWVIFPEGCLPGYPAWVWALHSGIDPLLDTLRAEVLDNAVLIPSDTTDRLCSIAQRAQVNVVVGVIERIAIDDQETICSSLLFISAQGIIVGRYRTSLASEATQRVWIPVQAETPIHESLGVSRIGGL
jgi:predicted amidohydrolase